jgi:ParB/RepB/Spo0J family partition protein
MEIAMPLDPTPCAEQVHLLPLAIIRPSPFNPRSQSDTARLGELADSLRTSGLQQPIVVRQVLENDAQWETVFGHRRCMAARALGWSEIPAIIRKYTDDEVVVAQAIENLQREDLSPMDEARGYQQLRDELKMPVDELIKRVGKSRTQVYARLKLLDLVPEGAAALEAGEIDAEVAQLIARIPLPKLQVKALAAIEKLKSEIYQDRDPSYREIRKMLVDDFTLQLKTSIFPLDDAALLPDAGTCLACPKRSGANVDLFGDIVNPPKTVRAHFAAQNKGEEICTDPDCFKAKRAAQLQREADELAAKGKTVVTGAAAKRALKADRYSGKVEVKGDYVAVTDVKAELKKAKDKGVEVVVLQDPATGKTVQAVKKEDLKAAGVKVKEEKKAERYDYAAEARKRDEERARREAMAAVEVKVRRAILDQVRAKVHAAPRSAFDLALVARAAYAGVAYEARTLLAKLWNKDGRADLTKAFNSMSLGDLTQFVMDCALVNEVPVNPWNPNPAETLLLAASHYKVDVVGIRKEVEAAIKEADEDAAKKAAAYNSKKGKK